MERSKIGLLNVEVDALTIPQLQTIIAQSIVSKTRAIIVSQNLHSVYLCQRDSTLRALQSVAYTRIDGMLLVFLGKLLGLPLKREHRVTWVDWMLPFMSEAAGRNWHVFYIGSRTEIAERGAQKLINTFPGLRLTVTDGYFDCAPDSDENQNKLELIRKAQPDVLMVGMGMPRQEKWIFENLDNIHVNVILTCGAAMEYVVGVVGTPPRWMGRVGLEWAYRIGENPKRFWKRYILEPPTLIPLLIRDLGKTVSSTLQKHFSHGIIRS